MTRYKTLKYGHRCATPLEALGLKETCLRLGRAMQEVAITDPKFMAETTEQGQKIRYCIIENLRLACHHAEGRLRKEFLSV
jgi:hypothetical protein